jgi:hypothetical protein
VRNHKIQQPVKPFFRRHLQRCPVLTENIASQMFFAEDFVKSATIVRGLTLVVPK